MSADRSKDRHKPRATIAGAEDLWRKLGDAVGDGERSKVTRELWAWWLREPGARMPKRPTAVTERPATPKGSRPGETTSS
jgi:hypothetical protein